MAYEDQLLDEVKVFKDPVHRYVHVEDRIIWDLIATPEFQRLRRIKQLGTTNLTFHGAEHSRFNHSLGVYEIVRRMVTQIEHEESWNKDERLVCLCAALLHDIGHGPFSHSFEKVFELDHEVFSQKIILEDTGVNQVLRRVSADFPERVANVINKTYEDKLVVSVISSQIDADRMDYLLRDAYYTGVSYGQFDMERILRVMRPTEDKIVVKLTGMHAVEDYIMSRYQMYWQVYFHPVTRSAEVILTKVFDRVKHLLATNYTFKTEPTLIEKLYKEDFTVDDYLKLDETIIFYYFQQWLEEDDYILRDLSARFINRDLFKYVEFDPKHEQAKLAQLTDLCRAAGINPDYYLTVDSSSDLPYEVYGPGEGQKAIMLQMPDGRERELSEHSVIVESITGKKRVDHKLYYPEDLIQAINDVTIRSQMMDLLKIKDGI